MATESQPTACSENCLHIDLGCPLFIEFKGVKERQKSNLVGMVPGAYLIVTKPQMVGVRNLLEQEPGILVRYLYMGEVFGFRAEVVGVVTVPYALMFLSYPVMVERINLRRAARVACHLPATLSVKDMDAEGMIVDISGGGCRFTIKADMPELARHIYVGAFALLAFPLLGTEGRCQVQGLIRNVSEDLHKMSLGIQFQAVDKEIRERIENYIQRVQEFMDE